MKLLMIFNVSQTLENVFKIIFGCQPNTGKSMIFRENVFRLKHFGSKNILG
jgi:hypothetical protein